VWNQEQQLWIPINTKGGVSDSEEGVKDPTTDTSSGTISIGGGGLGTLREVLTGSGAPSAELLAEAFPGLLYANYSGTGELYVALETTGDTIPDAWKLLSSTRSGGGGGSGTNGADGADGKTILNGTTAPANTLGTDGDFYIDTTGPTLYGPKTGGAWPTGIPLGGGGTGTDAQKLTIEQTIATATGSQSETIQISLERSSTPSYTLDLSTLEEVTYADSPPTAFNFTKSPTAGDLFVDTANSTLWMFNSAGSWTQASSGNNIYTSDNTLTSSRTVTLDGNKTLTFTGGSSNTLIYDVDTHFNRGIKDSNGNYGLEGQVLSSTGTSSKTVKWIYPGGVSVLKTGNYTLAEEGTLYVQPSGAVTITLPDPSGKEVSPKP
jgi:hypothetical protein